MGDVEKDELKKENEKLKHDLDIWKKRVSEVGVKPCDDVIKSSLKATGHDVDSMYCSDPAHRFDPRCVKHYYKNPETKRLNMDIDSDSPYYDKRSAECLLGAIGIDYHVVKKDKTKDKGE